MKLFVLVVVLWVCLPYQDAAPAARAAAADAPMRTDGLGTAAAVGEPATPTEHHVRCALVLQGYGKSAGVKYASLNCSGGTVTAAAHPELRARLQSKGVVWSTAADCMPSEDVISYQLSEDTNNKCLLSICAGSNVTFYPVRVEGVYSTSPKAHTILCIVGDSNVSILDARFSECSIRPLAAVGASKQSRVQLQLHDCSFEQNDIGSILAGGALYTKHGDVMIHNSTFVGNRARHGGAMVAAEGARVTIVPAVHQVESKSASGGYVLFSNNDAAVFGGDILTRDNAELYINSTLFSSSSAMGGGSLYFENSAKAILDNVTITNGSSRKTGDIRYISFNFGGCIALEDAAEVTMKGSTVSNCRGPSGGVAVGVRFKSAPVMVLLQCSIVNNTATNETPGGGLVAGGSSNVTLQDTSLLGNNAIEGGGVTLFANASSTVLCGRLRTHFPTFGSNHAARGGAIRVKDNARVNIQTSADVAAAPPGERSRCLFFNNTATMTGGDVQATDLAIVSIGDTDMWDGVAESGGGSLYLAGQSNVTIAHTSWKSATSKQQGAGCIMVDDKANLFMQESTMVDCLSMSGGGGIGAAGKAVVSLRNTSIANNTAGQHALIASGGGVLAMGGSKIQLDSIVFVNNSASMTGGGLAVLEEAKLQLLGPSMFERNFAEVGSDVALVSTNFSPREVARYLDSSADVMFATKSIRVVGTTASLDNFVASTDLEQGVLQVDVRVLGAYDLRSDEPLNVDFVTSGGNVIFTQTTPSNHTDPRSVQLLLRSPPGNYTLVFRVASSTTPRAELPVRIVPCPKGFVTSQKWDVCTPCLEGFYSLDPTNTECKSCPPNAVCPGGGVIKPKEGFWHSHPEAVEMHRCFNSMACPGILGMNVSLQHLSGEAYKSAQCSEPYQGNLCGDCKDPVFGKVRPFLCLRCMPKAAIIVVFTVAAFSLVALAKALVHFATADVGERTDWKRPAVVELLRVLVLHSQWLYLTGNLVGIPWPPTLSYPMHALSSVWSSTSGASIGFECILPHNGVPIAIQKVLICLLTPAGIMVTILLLEAVTHLRRAHKTGASSGMNFISLSICIVFMFLPSWVNTTLSLFTCVALDQPGSGGGAVGKYWAEDMSQMCYDSSSYHRAWALGLGVPLTLLFCLGLPVGVFAFMWQSRNHGKLADPEFQRHYSFIYRLWCERVCWWEAVVLMQTVGLVMVSTFGFVLGPYYQTLVTAAVLALIAMMLLAVQPYRCKAANRIAVLSVCILFFTVYSALIFLPYNNLGLRDDYKNAIGVVIIILNLAFLGGTCLRLMQVVEWKAVCGWVGRMKMRRRRRARSRSVSQNMWQQFRQPGPGRANINDA